MWGTACIHCCMTYWYYSIIWKRQSDKSVCSGGANCILYPIMQWIFFWWDWCQELTYYGRKRLKYHWYDTEHRMIVLLQLVRYHRESFFAFGLFKSASTFMPNINNEHPLGSNQDNLPKFCDNPGFFILNFKRLKIETIRRQAVSFPSQSYRYHDTGTRKAGWKLGFWYGTYRTVMTISSIRYQ